MNRRLPLLLVLLACGEDNGGTAVGNPGKLSMAMEDLPPGTQLEQGSFDVAALELVGDRRRVSIVKFEEPFDLVDPAHVEFPGGAWHTAVFLPRGDQPLVLQGRHPDGSLFDYALPVEPMVFEGDLRIDGEPVVVGLSLVNAIRADTADDQAPPAEPGAQEDGDRFLGNFGVGQTLSVDGSGTLSTEGDVFLAQDAPTRGCSTAAPLALTALLRR